MLRFGGERLVKLKQQIDRNLVFVAFQIKQPKILQFLKEMLFLACD